jgi:sulfur-carrier protein adenylyltransferase/sulfurtransferase
MWFIGDAARLGRERAAVAALIAETDWLQDVDWRLTVDGRIRLDFSIVVGEQRFALRMTYPKLFPFTPPEVAPVGHDRRLSAHQYGDATGNLCLQHRPDNWVPATTGADMIRSAYELLSTEHATEGPAGQVPSTHRVAEGQQFRGRVFRLLVPAELREIIGQLPEGFGARAEVRLRHPAQCMTGSVEKLLLPEGEWHPPNVPKIGRVYKGVIARLSAAEYQALIDDTDGVLAAALRDRISGNLALAEYAEKEFVIATDGQRLTMAWQLSPQKEDISFFVPLDIDGLRSRLSPAYHALASKKVAIVGCGSAGSKIAVSLSRSGVGSFLLVDDDLFLRDNLVRHDLDWRNVGEHKVDGVACRIRGINPGADIAIRRLKLSGQESAGSAASALEQIAGCNLIIDATADPNAFNLLASVCTAAKKPMVWLEVFEGGIGGFVARHIPERDARPHVMRNAYNSWCRSQAVPWIGRGGEGYTAQAGDGPVLIADDADVAVIAAHAARMAIDALLSGNSFPHPMYVVSLRLGWIFEQPFEAHPIAVEAEAENPNPEADLEDTKQGLQFLVNELLPRVDDEAPAT